MNDYTIPITYKLYWFYPKYSSLEPVAKQLFPEKQVKSIDIYIDGTKFIESLLKDNVVINDKMAIVAGLVNLAIHFRKFYGRYLVYSHIYIIYSSIGMLANIDPIKKECLDSNLVLLRELCKYLKDIYFVETTVDTPLEICNMIENNPTKRLSIIYSKDPVMYQIPTIYNNAIVFNLTKNSQVEHMQVITNNNALLEYLSQSKRSIILENVLKLHPMLYSTVLTLIGCKERNIEKIFNTNKAISTILGAMADLNYPKLANSYPNIETLYESLKIDKYINKDKFLSRFKSIDLVYQLSIYKLKPESHDLSWQINIINNSALKEINDKYLTITPLNLNDLL